MLSVPVSVRGKSEERSLESLAENLKIFRETCKGVKSKAQKAFNVTNVFFKMLRYLSHMYAYQAFTLFLVSF